MYGTFQKHLTDELAGIEQAGLTKHERGIRGPQNTGLLVGRADLVRAAAANGARATGITTSPSTNPPISPRSSGSKRREPTA